MKIRAVVTLVAAIAVAAFIAIPAFAGQGGTERPFKTSGQQTGYYNFTNGSFDIVGPATSSHLGKGSAWTFSSAAGESDIFTAANGDKLYATAGAQLSTNLVCPDIPDFFNAGPFSESVNYSGGTGRFANATGTTVMVGCLYFGAEISPGVNTFYVTFSETGTLTY